MTDDELIAVIESELDQATGEYNSEIAENRSRALTYYMGQPRGDEVPNRSHVISTDVADALDWTLAEVLKAFSEAETICQFTPSSQEDVELSQQESDYINHLYWQRNDGFLNTYTWIKDALLSKNGYIHIHWDESERTTQARYKGLTDQQIAMLEQRDGVEIEEHEVYEQVIADPRDPRLSMQMQLHDVTVRRTYTEGSAQVMPVAPENVRIADEHSSVNLDDCRFVAHEREMTKSELLELGIDEKIVDLLPQNEDVYSEQDYARDAWDETGTFQREDPKDPSQQRVTVYDCTLLVDRNGDGIAERLKVLYAGHELLQEDEIDESGWVSAAANILTHKHNGISIYDRLKQIQDQKTAIIRNLLDNYYLTNNQRWKVRSGGRVNLDDLLDNRPGGPVRMKDINDLEPLTVQPIASPGFQLLDYLDGVMHSRTGAGPAGRGEDIPLPNSAATSVERIMSAKEELVGLMIRVLAETGFKHIWRKLHTVVRHNQQIAEVVQLRNKWVNVNPMEWEERDDLTVQVGLGSGDRMRKQSTLGTVLSLQEKMLASGGLGITVDPVHIYNAAGDMVRNAQMDPERYFGDPSEPQRAQKLQQQMQQKPEDPQVEIQKVLLQVESQKNQIRALEQKAKQQAEAQKLQLDRANLQLEQARKAFELQQKERELFSKMEQFEKDLQYKYDKLFEEQKTKLTELELEHGEDVPGSAV